MSSPQNPPPERLEPEAPSEFRQAAKKYLAFIEYEKGFSKTTVYGYASWLNNFENWLTENGYPHPTLEPFNTQVLTRFLHTLHARNLRPRSIRGVFYPLKGMGAYLLAQGIIEENPTIKIGMPKKDAAIRQTVTDAEVQSLLDCAGRIRNKKRAAMAKAVLSVFAFGGLRRTETIALHLSDVDTLNKSLLVRSGKGGKTRKVFPHESCIAAIGEWNALRGDLSHDMLFIGNSGRPLGEKALITLLDEIKCIAGFRAERRICLHALRHNCATRLLRNGADLGQIQQFLGHTAIGTTQVYLHTGEEDIRHIGPLTGIVARKEPASSKPEVRSTERRPMFRRQVR